MCKLSCPPLLLLEHELIINTSLKKVIFITGASHGLGRAIALEYSRLGHHLVLSARDEERLKSVCDMVNASGGHAEYIVCDVTNIDSVHNAIENCMFHYGRIDTAILNAGIGGSFDYGSFDRNVFNKVLNTNLHGVLNCMSEIIPVMKKQGSGTIVGISSLADTRTIPGNSAYIISKMALSNALEAANIELRGSGITVVTVRPGFIKTNIIEGNTHPMPFLMSPEKAARIIVKGIIRGRTNISFPFPLTALSFVVKLVPTTVWKFIFKYIPQRK